MQHENQEEDIIDLKQILSKLTDNWIWFLVSCVICLSISILYIKFTPSTYQITAKLLVNDDEKGGALGKQAGSLMDLGGIMASKNSVDNESEILKTRFLMEEVVRAMNLDIVYSQKINFIKEELYNSPFKINILKKLDTVKTTNIGLSIDPSNHVSVNVNKLKREVRWFEKFTLDGVGIIQIIPTSYKPNYNKDYYATVYSLDERVASIMRSLSVAVSNKQVSIINLVLSHRLPKRGEDILNTLIAKYTQSNLSDKNAVADSTYHFIKERLNVIATELGDVEDKVENFKQRNKLADMTEQGKLLVQNTSDIVTELAKVETQINVLVDLEKYLKDNSKRVFPSSLIPQDIVFSNLMSQYNSLLIEREKQLMGVTEQSPFIQNIDSQITGLRNDILSNISISKNSYILSRNKLSKQLNSAEGQISGVPEVEKNYLKLARNQQIKQELYIFLMQKAEETAISKTSNISVAKVIDPPKADGTPISPRKGIVYLGGLMAGLFFPVVIIFTSGLFSTAIKTKQDIISLTHVPVIGEISHNRSSDNLVVANQSRSAISEQFRALRTNLSFYLKNKNEKIILLTSSMSGEGKSFTAINLGNILALAGKKVLLMELDLRKPGLSAKLGISNDLGFSTYTVNQDLTAKDIIKPLAINNNMFIVPSGPLPPNPAETIMSDRTAGLIKELKDTFDYIILDAPPVGIITDAQLLSDYADATIYLVRQKITRKDQLKIVEDLYIQKKMKNIGIVVNDIMSKYYGYGYGYGSYGESIESNLLSRIKKKFINK